MVWRKINKQVEFWETPVLGTKNLKDGKRFMALCVDPSSKYPYRGIARQVLERIGNEDIPGYLDRSKLVIVESYDLLNWKVICDLQINGIKKIIDKLIGKEKEFIGLEDPDIIINKDNKKHLYFTIPFKYHTKSINDVDRYDVHIGHAEGFNLENLKATMPVLGKINKTITGFKEICPIPLNKGKNKLILCETFVNKGKEKKYSAIGLSKVKSISKKWNYVKLVHDPLIEIHNWCKGYSSPCRIFNPDFLNHKGYLVGIMNGREPTKKLNKKLFYGKFRPGLFLFDINSEKIVWIDENPLLEDPVATTITFGSDLVYLNKKEAILFAHPNDSFVRAYKLNLEKIKERLSKISI